MPAKTNVVDLPARAPGFRDAAIVARCSQAFELPDAGRPGLRYRVARWLHRAGQFLSVVQLLARNRAHTQTQSIRRRADIKPQVLECLP